VAEYTYVARDLLTGLKLAELPLRDVEFTGSLTDAGQLTGVLPLLGLSPSAQVRMDIATQEARTSLWVYRGQRLVWGGILWLRPYDDSGNYKISASEWRSWLARRPLTLDKTFTGIEQFVIVRDLINWAQTGVGQPSAANVGIVTSTESSGILRDRSYDAADLKSIDAYVQEMSDDINGFDWTVAAVTDAATGKPYPLLQLGFPRLGRTAAVSGHVWEMTDQGESSIVAFSWPGDGSQFATRVIGIGEGSLRSTATNTTLLTAGYPLIDSTVSRTDVVVQATLDSIVLAELQSRSSPLVEPTLLVKADAEPEFGSWRVGDDCRVRIVGNPRWPDDLDVYARIIGYKAKPVDGAETVEVQLAPMLAGSMRLVRRTRSYGRNMSALERRLLALEAK
jgi:hypothetical protein